MTAPGTPFQIAIPNACANVGQSFCTQGASVDATLAFQLTNALDIVMETLQTAAC